MYKNIIRFSNYDFEAYKKNEKYNLNVYNLSCDIAEQEMYLMCYVMFYLKLRTCFININQI